MENETQYNILILDDHPVVLSGVCQIIGAIENAVCYTASNLDELLNLLQLRTYNLLILDLELSGTDGFQVINEVRSVIPECKILIYSMHEEPWILASLLPYNIDGILSKNTPTDDLVNAVKIIMLGGAFYSKAYENIVNRTRMQRVTEDGIKLSIREKEVLAYISKGYTTRAIAETLCLSTNTVATHRKRLMKKLNAKNAADLALRGKGLIFNPLPPLKVDIHKK